MTDNKCKLWIFGDSYAVEGNHWLDYKNTHEWTWFNDLARRLDAQPSVISQMGISNEWLFMAIRDHLAQITPADYVILITTQQDRRWFFKQLPHYGNLGNFENITRIKGTKVDHPTPSQSSAVRNYITHLQDENEVLSMCYHETLIGWFDSLGIRNRWRYCAIPAFEITPLHITQNASLNDVSNREFGSPDLAKLFYEISGRIDRRICHMSRPNHTVLADKLYTNFTQKEWQPVDMSTGFHTNLYTTQQQVEEFKVSL